MVASSDQQVGRGGVQNRCMSNGRARRSYPWNGSWSTRGSCLGVAAQHRERPVGGEPAFTHEYALRLADQVAGVDGLPESLFVAANARTTEAYAAMIFAASTSPGS